MAQRALLLDRYWLISPVKPGGNAYRGESVGDGVPVEVRLLGAARLDSESWTGLCRRIRRAALLQHAAARQIRGLHLDEEPPCVALEAIDSQPLTVALRDRLPLADAELIAVALALAGVLHAAHRLGLVHGQITPESIHWTTSQHPKLDFTGTETPTFRHGLAPGPEGSPADDIFQFGRALLWLRTGLIEPGNGQAKPDHALEQLIQRMLAPEAAERPSAREVELCLARSPGAVQQTGEWDTSAVRVPPAPLVPSVATTLPADELLERKQLGRFRLVHRLGEGGMGAVYRAEDIAERQSVAIKVLRPEWTRSPNAVRRFYKEARLLAEVQNPHVTRLIEVNEDDGIHYLVLEFVQGKSVGALLGARQQLPERLALNIAADVARALVDAHERGIIHRDIKPENILIDDSAGKLSLNAAPTTARSDEADYGLVKLTDFGLARHINESESLHLTRTGAVVGTPLYMAPEQCSAGAVDTRTDIYGLGATLYHMLAGRPPFLGESPTSVIAQHCNDLPPPLRRFNPAVSDGACQVVEKCLAKAPEARYADAAGLLADLERLVRGEPTSITVHPRLPKADPAKVIHYDWVWQLEASPEQLWPHVSNTDRLNRAAGLPPVQFTTEADADDGVRRFGRIRRTGVTATWREHPFEWVEARRMGVLREFVQGPFQWVISLTELAPRPGGGTSLAHRVRVEPRGLLGRTVAAVEIGIKGHRAVDRIYRRIDAALTGKLGGLEDPFEEPAELSGARRRKLDQILERLNVCGVASAVVERLGDFVSLAPAQEVARIRPLALAKRLGLDPEQVVAACLHGAREGLLVLHWDILCPVCRIPSEIKDTLRALREHARCEVCNLDFELDFANSVEMIFRAHPQIRETDLATYCVGGPAHSPHVIAQVRVAPAERIELELALAEGAYRLRGPQLPFSLDFRVQPIAPTTRWDLNLARGPHATLPRALRTGRQLVVLTNDHTQELIARVERVAPREDALTAARASSLALFRELFPNEVLSPGQLVSVANVTLLVTALDQADALYTQLGDTRAFAVLHEHFRILDQRIRQEGGALIKTIGEGVVAAFTEPVAAVRAAVALRSILNEATSLNLSELGGRLKVAVHRGPAMAATLNDHLDYFGTTANVASQLPRWARGGEVVLTLPVASDLAVSALLETQGLQSEIVRADLPGCPGGMLHRLRAR
jgi:eukaryotic-like serine/threonine-protein kinase